MVGEKTQGMITDVIENVRQMQDSRSREDLCKVMGIDPDDDSRPCMPVAAAGAVYILTPVGSP